MKFPYLSVAFLSFIALLLTVSCNKQEYISIEENDTNQISDYILANGLQMEELENTGIFYQVLEQGTGSELSYSNEYALVYTWSSLDGSFIAQDTFAATNRYFDPLGYFHQITRQSGTEVSYIFPGGSGNSGEPNSPMEREEGIKRAILRGLQRADGKIRILVPSRYLYARSGDQSLGIPSNASMDFTIHVIEDREAYEDGRIRARIMELGDDVASYEETPSGVYYQILDPGDGSQITIDSTISVKYSVKYLNGSVLESSDSARFALNSPSLFSSWKEVLPNINKGGSVRFLTPSTAANSPQGARDAQQRYYTFPAVTSLDFEVEVLD